MDEHLKRAIDAWLIALAARIRLWMDRNNITQDGLTEILHYKRNTTVNLALNKPTEKLTEPFIAKLSGYIPEEFGGAIGEYRELVDSQYGPAEKREELIGTQQEKGDKIAMLREAIARLQELLEIRISE